MAISIIDLHLKPGALAKLAGKHHLSEDDVRELIPWPARIPVAFDDDPRHGPRWVALIRLSGGEEFFAALTPRPEYDGERATSWELITAYWL
ncbi:MAG: hypothetical protein QM572_01645 [Nocardioides sp.]|uniref:hypothetical protein n=1 Tax=Nocardioides sp. TaxID=35761 RepID=UPI0039E559E7